MKVSFGALNLDTGTQILFVSIFILLGVALILLLVRSIIKERRKLREKKEQGFLVSLDSFKENIKRHIEHSKKVPFTVFRVDISESKSLIKSLGEAQFRQALSILSDKWKLLFESGVRMTKDGDETVIFFTKTKYSVSSLDNVLNMMLGEAKKSIVIAGSLKADFDVNIGVVSYPDDGLTLEALDQNLLLAVVQAKRKGINQFAVYDITLTNKESEEYKNYLEIKSAIENKEFTLYYQPVISLKSMEVFAAESLLRWKHKERGVLPPSTFLNIMEHTGDINWVGFWAIEQLFKQLIDWRSHYPDFKFKVSLNLSPKQLMNSVLPDELRRLVKKYRINPQDVVLEIVEFTLIDSFDTVKDNLEALKAIGFLLAVDNYGGNQASLQNLSKISIDILKLSRKFVKESETNELTLNIINMWTQYAKKNNITIIAEGVENAEVLTYIASLGIEYGQGYFFQRPGTPQELINSAVMTPWADNEDVKTPQKSSQ